MAILMKKKSVGVNRNRSYRKMFAKNHCVVVNGDSLESSHGVSWVRLHLLGEGGFGSVFYAKRRIPIKSHLPFEIAVKSAKTSDSSVLQYEKRILCNLGSSPYVVHCYGEEITQISNGEKVYNLLLEFCSGGSLLSQIKLSDNGLAESEVQNYTRDILQGLKYIHSQGYVHCDIKPANILLVTGSGERSGKFMAKIADFGLAKVMKEEEEECAELRGTYLYMSPEYVKDKKLECSADIWALGCVVLEMLTGKPAWGYSSTEAMLFVLGYTNKLPVIPDHLSCLAQDFLCCCLDRQVDRRLSPDSLLEHPFVCEDDCANFQSLKHVEHAALAASQGIHWIGPPLAL